LYACSQNYVHVATIDIVASVCVGEEDASDFMLLGQLGKVEIVL